VCLLDEGDRSDIDLSDDHRRLHLHRVGAVHAVGRLGLLDRVLLLLRHAVDDRLRRHRARHRAQGVGGRAEAHLLRCLDGVRTVAARHVLQPDAGGGQGEVRVVRTQARTAQKRRSRWRLICVVASICDVFTGPKIRGHSIERIPLLHCPYQRAADALTLTLASNFNFQTLINSFLVYLLPISQIS